MLKEIRDGLIRLAKRIGHWIVRRFVHWAATRLVAWLRDHVDDWKIRKVYPGRRRRWAAAADWIEKHTKHLAACAAHEYDALADKLERRGVPEVAA